MRLLVGHVERCRRHKRVDHSLVVDELRGGGVSGLGGCVSIKAAFLRERRAVVHHSAHGIASVHVHQAHGLDARRCVILDGTGYLAWLHSSGEGGLEHLARTEIHVAVVERDVVCQHASDVGVAAQTDDERVGVVAVGDEVGHGRGLLFHVILKLEQPYVGLFITDAQLWLDEGKSLGQARIDDVALVVELVAFHPQQGIGR